MALTVEDLRDLLVLLRQHPEWRDAVRREVLTEELLGLPPVVLRLAGRTTSGPGSTGRVATGPQSRGAAAGPASGGTGAAAGPRREGPASG